MNIYIQSRGYDQDKDYLWIKVIENGTAKEEIPPLSKNAISLIESSSPSVVLERLPEERLLLLITGFEPEKRLDIINRQIRIDLALVATNSDEDELALRPLAAKALIEEKRQLLTTEISQAVELLKNPTFLQVYPEDIHKIKPALEEKNFSNLQELAAMLNLSEETVSNFCEGKAVKFQDFVEIDKKLELNLTQAKEIYFPPEENDEENIYANFVDYGFYVSLSKLMAVTFVDKNGEFYASEMPDLTNKIGPNSPELRKQLAEEIMRCKLPLEIAPLVVVTGFTKTESLVEAKIWRGLSKLVDTDSWKEIEKSQPKNRFSLSMLVGVVSGWLKSVSEFASKIEVAENSEDKKGEPGAGGKEA